MSPENLREVDSFLPIQGEISLQEFSDALALATVRLCLREQSTSAFGNKSSRNGIPVTPPSSPCSSSNINSPSSLNSDRLSYANDGDARASREPLEHPQNSRLPAMTNPFNPTIKNSLPFDPYDRNLVSLIASPPYMLRALLSIPDFVKQSNLLEFMIRNRVHQHLSTMCSTMTTDLVYGHQIIEANGSLSTLHYYAQQASTAWENTNSYHPAQLNPHRNPSPEIPTRLEEPSSSLSSSFTTSPPPRHINFEPARFPAPSREDPNDPYFNFRTRRCHECNSSYHKKIHCSKYMCGACDAYAPGHYDYECDAYYCHYCQTHAPGHSESTCSNKPPSDDETYVNNYLLQNLTGTSMDTTSD